MTIFKIKCFQQRLDLLAYHQHLSVRAFVPTILPGGIGSLLREGLGRAGAPTCGGNMEGGEEQKRGGVG